MNDVLTTLDQISEDVTKLVASISSARGKSVPPAAVQPIARVIARVYFESVRPELQAVQNRTGLVEEIDFVLQQILRLANSPRAKEAYIGQIAELRPYLLEATIDLMKARGSPRLILSQTERSRNTGQDASSELRIIRTSSSRYWARRACFLERNSDRVA